MVHEIDPLVATIQVVNDTLVGNQRSQSIKQIESQIEAIKEELKVIGQDSTLSSSCLKPLETLKTQVVAQTSLAHITQAESDAENLKDSAISRIADFISKQAEEKKDDDPVLKPKFRKPKVVKPKQLTAKTYLETQDEIDEFLKALRIELETALKKDERIEIR
jgi:hypothetical protein